MGMERDKEGVESEKSGRNVFCSRRVLIFLNIDGFYKNKRICVNVLTRHETYTFEYTYIRNTPREKIKEMELRQPVQ